MKGQNEEKRPWSRLPCLIELCKMGQQRLNQHQNTKTTGEADQSTAFCIMVNQ